VCCCPILFALSAVRCRTCGTCWESLLLYKHPGGCCKDKAQHDSADSRHQEGHDSPFKAAGFLADGKKGGGAGPVHQGEEHGADSGNPGPAVIYQQIPQLCQAVKFQKASLGHIGHDDDGNYDFIGWKSQDKCHQNHAVHAKKLCKGIQEAGAMCQQGDAVYLYICHNPD